ncbi:MAG: SDR family oxidoreductase [Anaerolineales bacterium]
MIEFEPFRKRTLISCDYVNPSGFICVILVTGGTGFLGRAVIRQVPQSEYRVRTLMRPSRRSPELPAGIPVEAAISSLLDKRGVRAAMVGVDSVLHLAGAERGGLETALRAVDVEGTRVLVEAARQAGVSRLVYVSHLGAEPSSAFPALRAKALAEDAIRKSGLPYTIIRSSLVYGEEDRFTTSLAMLLGISPGIFPLPGDGKTAIQPVWVDDLATCVAWSLDEEAMIGQTYDVGGPEFLTLRQVVELVMQATGTHRWLVSASPLYLRGITWLIQRVLPNPPLTTFWFDYLASSRTASLDALPRIFGLKPSMMIDRLRYLGERNWTLEFMGRQLRWT